MSIKSLAEKIGMVTFMVPEWAEPTPDVRSACTGILQSLHELPALLIG